MRLNYFVTGTDTGIGKTLVTCALLEAANAKGMSTLGLKPLAAGCELINGEMCNDDALAIQECSTVKLAYQQVNPLALQAAMAPHLAAAREGKRLGVDRLAGYCRGAMQSNTDFCLLEGAGGWRIPLNPAENLSSLAKELNLPVILVVGMRLGCLNHALLTAEAIQRDGLELAAWVANKIDPAMDALEENIDTLKTLLPCPMLGVLPWFDGSAPTRQMATLATAYLNIRPLVPAL